MKRLFWVIVLIGLMIPLNGVIGAEIDPLLQSEMDRLALNEDVSAIVYMMEQADIPALNNQLKVERATLAERNRRVILALQEVATATQPPVIAQLNELKDQNKIKDYTKNNTCN